ncbi:hypothetical protein QT970_23585 [Microcoleus sp. herbarium8]
MRRVFFGGLLVGWRRGAIARTVSKVSQKYSLLTCIRTFFNNLQLLDFL